MKTVIFKTVPLSESKEFVELSSSHAFMGSTIIGLSRSDWLLLIVETYGQSGERSWKT